MSSSKKLQKVRITKIMIEGWLSVQLVKLTPELVTWCLSLTTQCRLSSKMSQYSLSLPKIAFYLLRALHSTPICG
jgi:hypothetical protein